MYLPFDIGSIASRRFDGIENILEMDDVTLRLNLESQILVDNHAEMLAVCSAVIPSCIWH